MTELTILMPCLNESETLGTCIKKAQAWIARSGIKSEILIADNGSTDGSQQLARALGARVVDVVERGYGSALYYGAMAASGKWIIMGDSDDSYDFSNLDPFMEKLREGYDLVMGNRFAGGISPGAMPWKNRHIGNPLLTTIGKILFKSHVNDFHCGLRGFRKEAFIRMDLRTTGMEFASEMVIKATLLKMRICEVPTVLHKDGRHRPPHLRPWRDGWRHLRFMLLFSPRWLFLNPGMILLLVSLIAYGALLFHPIGVGGVVLDIHTLLFAEAGIAIGTLVIATGIVARLIGTREGFLQSHVIIEKIQRSPVLEIGSVLGLVMILTGLAIGWHSFSTWASSGFGPLFPNLMVRKVSMSTLLIVEGGIVLTFSMLFGFLSLPTRRTL